MVGERRASATSNVSLEQRAWNIRRKALLMGEVQGQGYIGQALGVADVLATAYFHALDYRADEPEWEGRDRFLLSIGHYAIALYAVLMEARILPEESGTTSSLRPCRTSVGTRTCPSQRWTSTCARVRNRRAAFCGEVVLRQSSLNQSSCSSVPPGMKREVKSWRKTGLLRPQPCSMSSSIAW